MKNEDQARSHKLEARPSRRGPGSIAAGVLLTLIVALPVIMAVAAAVYYIFGPAEGHFHADSADTLYWANASFESGKILDPTFRYAAVLPFSASLWMTPLIAVFGFTMTAQNIGMMIFVLVFCASLGYFCRRAEMSVGWCTLSVGMTLMILSSSDKLREVMLGHVIYYSLGLVLFFLIAGLMLSVSSRGAALMSASPEAAPTSKKLLFGLAFIMLVVISAGAATDGAEIIVLATLPALGGVAAERIFDGNRRVFSRENIPAWIALLGVLAGTLCGVVILKMIARGVTADHTNIYSTYSDTGSWMDNLLRLPTDYIRLLGVETETGDAIFGTRSFVTVIRIIVCVILWVCPLAMFCLYRRIAYRATRVMLWSHTVLSGVILFGYICGRLSDAGGRLSPMVGSAVVLAVFAGRELAHCGRARLMAAGEAERSEAEDAAVEEPCPAQTNGVFDGRIELRTGLALLLLLCISAFASFGDIVGMPSDYGRDNEAHTVAAFLEENGLEYGYATFRNSNLLTPLTDSRVKVRGIAVSSEDGIYTDLYQSSSRLYDESEHGKYEKYFILLSESEYNAIAETGSWRELTSSAGVAEELRCGGWHVFVLRSDPQFVIK